MFFIIINTFVISSRCIFIKENVKLNLTHRKSHQELTELYFTEQLYMF